MSSVLGLKVTPKNSHQSPCEGELSCGELIDDNDELAHMGRDDGAMFERSAHLPRVLGEEVLELPAGSG